MIELPEAILLSKQLAATLKGKVITDVIADYSPHKFAFFNGDPEGYSGLLAGKRVDGAKPNGGQVELYAEDTRLVLTDGVNLRYIEPGGKLPPKHQLLIGFDDHSCIVASVQMYGMLWAFKAGELDHPYYTVAKERYNALDERFDEQYFGELVHREEMQKKSVKAMLATEQTIPGLGNGVLQDILYRASLHPRRKVSGLSGEEQRALFHSLKTTLAEMVAQGGRDTEKDLFGQKGGYRTEVCKNTLGQTCSRCGEMILKESYLGGTVYYCSGCQKE